MNLRLISHILGVISLIVAGFMTASLPWSLPICGQVTHFDRRGFFGVLAAILVSLIVSGLLLWYGRRARSDRLLRREALAAVGLAWLVATILGALPYICSGTCRGIDDSGKPIRMTVFDAIFESASGYSGTGATVLADVENPDLVPRSVLFWRSETHFLGGLGIVVLFVAILGMGSAGKQLIRAEVATPTQTSTHEQTRRAAMAFGTVFVVLNLILTFLLMIQGLSIYDAICHAFGTVATGGFSTYNDSIGHFKSPLIDFTVVLFMLLGCTNFGLLYFAAKGDIKRLVEDVEFRTYLAICMLATISVSICLAVQHPAFSSDMGRAIRCALFQCVSIQTNTGFATDDFNEWPPYAKGILLMLMYVGGCAGSTSCSVKVIRYIFLFKICALEIEQAYHPNVVRIVRVGGRPVTDADLLKSVLVYFGLVVLTTAVAWLAILAVEPSSTWGVHPDRKLLDCFSAVAATLNGVGPGLGLFGPLSNYGAMHAPAKCILTLLMLLGRLEYFPLLVLVMPRFWKSA
ncbi:MAG TPA: TrkH family potassium uptake protein [Thermogutta sp.]|nr:TrkH family potassium uptake protein [Thermogutta sp.]HPU05633.1 TrkH family potassium uptake protein [Thermogutta sp.]